MDEIPLYTMTSPSLQSRWTGSCPQFVLTSSSLNLDGRAPTIHIDELFPQLRWTSSYNSHRRALPSRQTDELLPINHIDELFPPTSMDELPLYTLTSPSLQSRWTGSCPQFVLTSSSPNSDGRAPTIHIDELFPQLRWTSSYNSHRRALPSRPTDELLPINHIVELFPRHRGRAPTIHSH